MEIKCTRKEVFLLWRFDRN